MGTIEKFSTLRIKGGIFETETDLPLFEKGKQIPKVSLLYGKNGTGKSTISRSFRKLVGVEENQIDTVEIIDAQNVIIPITEELKEAIYVFNEDFIEDNIRIDNDGLNTIVVMGAVKDIDDQIKKLEPEYIKSVENVKKQQEKCAQYSDVKNENSPDYYLEKMQNALKGEGNWAARDAMIFGRKTNSPVKKDTYTKFLKRTPQKKRDELIVDFNTVLKQLEDAKSGRRQIEKNVPKLEEYLDVEEEAIRLLREIIERPVLSDRERKLLSLLQEENGTHKLINIKNYFTIKEQNECPFCFQEIKKEYAEELIASIEKILNKKVEEHQKNLQKLQIQKYEMDLSAFKEISEEVVKNCEERLIKLNAKVDKLNDLLEQKTSNVYEAIVVDSFDLKKTYDECVFELDKLEKLREEFNRKATNTTPWIDKLNKINNDIAFYDIIELYKLYNIKIRKKREEEDILKKYEVERDGWKSQISELVQKKKNVKIAMDAINDDLAYIFFSRDRLKIENDDEKYILYSHGKSVKPSNISVGERNAIGLCYFFNRIMENRNEAEFLKQSYLLVIDDPVSSFDMENRMGILSYMKYKLAQFMQGNMDSRVLIMTHDLQTFYDVRCLIIEILEKIRKDKGLSGKAAHYLKEMELKNKSVEVTNICGRNEYTALLEIVYDYAVNIEPAYSMNIGNIMRKVMEAFGTFVYKEGMSELSTCEKVLGIFTEKKEKQYFENLMYRLVLNTGSHMKDKAMTIADMKFFDYISDEDKQRSARDIMCFLYKLNPVHVISHLENRGEAELKIQEWYASIK